MSNKKRSSKWQLKVPKRVSDSGDNDKHVELNEETVNGVFGNNVNETNDSDKRTNNTEYTTDTISYATMVKKDEIPINLNYIPIVFSDTSNEVMVFDEMLVQKGSKIRNLNVCRQFVRSLDDEKQAFVCSKVDPEMGMQKIKPKKFPVYVKILNVPLEAWCLDGISALSRSLGKPMLMDIMIATMCHNGIGNLEYARVLVEMEAEKEFNT
ncbi:zinc knuckle CX2CX4HX4C containing protein [Tanacetum coccineum]|uniref:Zinc knuckle CX2CX4HX4C containing protein n=1 Tax=Tanacetum coccineum TaxID=301880 RepID=A0ABQ4WBR2_9ASTR